MINGNLQFNARVSVRLHRQRAMAIATFALHDACMEASNGFNCLVSIRHQVKQATDNLAQIIPSLLSQVRSSSLDELLCQHRVVHRGLILNEPLKHGDLELWEAEKDAVTQRFEFSGRRLDALGIR